MATTNPAHDPHQWAGKTPDEVLETLVRELYAPVSALGDEIDRLSTGAFEDDDLPALLDQMREGVNQLSRVVVALKRYTADRQSSQE
jgi:hypothetical protein